MRLLRFSPALLAFAALTASAAAAQPKTVVFMTDFGLRDPAVAICKGVMWSLEPALRIVDLSHDVEPYAILDGARFLAQTAPHYPAGTVFVTVIDPGVGSERRALVARAKNGQFFVLPDNGLLTLLEDAVGLEEVRAITDITWFREPTAAATFHRRDIFAPVAARIARGDDWTKVGPTVATWERLAIPRAARAGLQVTGAVLAIEHPYGNLITNIPAEMLEELGATANETTLRIRIAKGRDVRARFVRTFSDVLEGAPLAFIDSRGTLGLALNMGHFAQKHGVKKLSEVAITLDAPRKP